MIPRNHQNSKLRIDLSCPTCGMSLEDPRAEGFVANNQTYCCEGCAEGTECTCVNSRPRVSKAGEKPGHMGQRNPENSIHDSNFNEEVNTSGQVIGRKRETEDAPARMHSRVPYVTQDPKQKRSLTKPRDSTRVPARGRSEFVKRRSGETHVDRISDTAAKSTKQR
jgi:hypothetical protein